jgi:hypothetical protein
MEAPPFLNTTIGRLAKAAFLRPLLSPTDKTLKAAIALHLFLDKANRAVTLRELHEAKVAREPRLFFAIVILCTGDLATWVRTTSSIELTAKGKRTIKRYVRATSAEGDLANVEEVQATLCGKTEEHVRVFRCQDHWHLEWALFRDGAFSAWTLAPIERDTFVIIGYLLGLASDARTRDGGKVDLGKVKALPGASLMPRHAERHPS